MVEEKRLKPFLILVNEITYNDRQRLRTMLSEIGATLRRTSTPMSGPVEVMVEMIETDLDKVQRVFKQIGILVIGVEEIPVEE